MEHKMVGVVVARMQRMQIDEGLRGMLDEAAKHDQLLVVLASPQTWVPDGKNPLDLAVRKAMVLAYVPQATVVELKARRTDQEWSEALESLVRNTHPDHEPVLYGSQYAELFEDAVSEPGKSPDFRAGAIYAASKRPALLYQAADIAIVDWHNKRVLLGRKLSDSGALRFIGGFVDTTDASLEAAAKREACEEAPHIETADFRYLGSSIIDDWRYRHGSDRIMSAFFAATYVFGHAQAGDDLDGLEWVSVEHLEERLVAAHAPFAKLLITHFTNH